jgi:hypothetical protein
MIDIGKLPVIMFDLSQYLIPSLIKHDMKKAGITSYVYAFYHKGVLMKYGVQYDSNDDTFGERVYRQAFHIPGWPKQPSKRSAGNDMLDIIVHFPGINKNNVTIQIWDMTNYPRANSNNQKYEVNQVERQLIKAYIALHGIKPIGNIKDEDHMDNKVQVEDVMFNSLFEFDN